MSDITTIGYLEDLVEQVKTLDTTELPDKISKEEKKNKASS